MERQRWWPARKAFHAGDAIPLSLYVHWPWCVRKCPYCDFNSHESAPQEGAYLAALIADLDAALPAIWGRPNAASPALVHPRSIERQLLQPACKAFHAVVSVFIGGGTPSLMSGAAVAALLDAIRARLRLLPGAEITLEANPGSAEAQHFAAYADAGVNRLSLGIQSFDDTKLMRLGRIHSGSDAHRAIEIAQRHFDHVNLDLMVALPEQTLEQARRDIETAIATGVGHISAYHLTVEPNTAFAHAPPLLPDEDLAADMLEMAEESLAAAGFEHYETSAYAQPGQHCRHNLNYWSFGDYLGIGAGAHSKISDHAGIRREARPRHPKDYIADAATRDWRAVAPADLPGEFMMNALRLGAGFPLTLFSERTGLQRECIQAPLLAAQRKGLIEMAGDRLLPTPLGRRFLNQLIGLFLDVDAR